MADGPAIDTSYVLPELNRLIQIAEMAGEPEHSVDVLRGHLGLLNHRAEELVPELSELRLALSGILDRLQMVKFALDDRPPTVEVCSDESAGEAQRMMQPERGSATFGSISVHVRTTWVDHCGGDWWHLRPLAEGDGLVGLGDVSGHGMAAGMVAASLNATFRQVCRSRKDLADIVSQMDQSCRELFQGAYLSSMVAARWSERASTLSVCNAGHRVPYLVKANDTSSKAIMPIGGHKALPLGAKAKQTQQCTSVVLEPGDKVMLYTDGIMEVESQAGKEFGFRRMRSQLERIPVEGLRGPEIVDELMKAMIDWADGRPVDDDVTLMIVERR